MLNLNSDFELRDLGVSNALGLELLPRHRWYFVKEGFSPVLVEQAMKIDCVKRGDVLLDPFSGSGTVPLTGAVAGLNAHAFEVNPFLHFLSATKVRRASPKTFETISHNILRALERPVVSPLEGVSTFSEGNRWNRWLFPLSVLRTFEAGSRALVTTANPYRNLLKLTLLGAAMDCCNAERDGKCLRYKPNWRASEATACQFRRCFRLRAAMVVEDLSTTPIRELRPHVIRGDARRLLHKRATEKFRLCVTSPPYLNSFDYSDVYRPELFLGGFVASNKELMQVRLKTVRSHVQASWKRPISDEFGTLYADCISKLRCGGDHWDSRIPLMVQAYFEDMETVLRGLRARAEKNSSVWLVVSTSAYAGVEVPVDLILAELGQRNGWYLREVGVLRYLRSSSQHVQHVAEMERKSVPLRESVVIFDASR